jgi:predicted MFS family arabinose efflux permease
MWGVIQPVAGAASDRYGPAKVLIAGLVVFAVGTAMLPFMTSAFGLVLALGLLSAVGAGAASFSVLIGAAAQHLAADRRGRAAGIINAGGSFGQFAFAPISQGLIQLLGWMGAMWSLAIIALAALPLVRIVTPSGTVHHYPAASAAAPWLAMRDAIGDRSYWLLHAGFFTCGFHIAFLVTHLPGEVDLCGLPPTVASWSLALIGLSNIAGSLAAGSLTARYRSKYILALMYGSRALLIAWYLLAPKTDWTFYAFAVGLGLTWLATVPPTAAIVAKLFGARYLATLFGLTLLSHQIGGFLGAYLGGIAVAQTGDFHWMWYADMALAAAAAIINLPIREAPIKSLAIAA